MAAAGVASPSANSSAASSAARQRKSLAGETERHGAVPYTVNEKIGFSVPSVPKKPRVSFSIPKLQGRWKGRRKISPRSVERPGRCEQALHCVRKGRGARGSARFGVGFKQPLWLRPAPRAACACPAQDRPPAKWAGRGCASPKKSPGPRVSRSYLATAKAVRRAAEEMQALAHCLVFIVRDQDAAGIGRPAPPRARAAGCSAERPEALGVFR